MPIKRRGSEPSVFEYDIEIADQGRLEISKVCTGDFEEYDKNPRISAEQRGVPVKRRVIAERPTQNNY